MTTEALPAAEPRRGVGRPRKPNAARRWVMVRVTDAELAKIERLRVAQGFEHTTDVVRWALEIIGVKRPEG